MSWTDDFSYLLRPVPEELRIYAEGDGNRLGNLIPKHDEKGVPDPSEAKLALIGIKEGRRSGINGLEEGADAIRSRLYELFAETKECIPVDLGNIEAGEYPHDTDAALREVVGSLLSRKITAIVFGGSHDMTLALHQAFEVLEVPVNVGVIDRKFDLGEFREELSPDNYLSKIVLHDPSYLFNLCVLGYQSYYADPESVKLMEKLFFDYERLGELKSDPARSEPFIRNSDILSVDMSSIKNDSAPGTAQPNGFSGEELCRMARYAGLSDKTIAFGLFEYNQNGDPTRQQALLIAQAIWYFMHGFRNRVREYPLVRKQNFREFKIQLPGHKDDLIFYKSKRTDKWWMNVHYAVKDAAYPDRNHIIPCSYEDYRLASEGEIPDLWWRTYRKLT
jgi:arginase family enzyme